MSEKQTRELLVKVYEKNHNVSEVARNFSVNKTTVYNYIKNLIEEQNDINIHEITEKPRLTVSNKTVRRAVIKIGYISKKKLLHASERELSRCICQKKKTGLRTC